MQQSLFGRHMIMHEDELVGFELGSVQHGPETHSIVKETGDAEHRVKGMVLEMTDRELAVADEYEPEEYKRISTVLASGQEVWVYTDARG